MSGFGSFGESNYDASKRHEIVQSGVLAILRLAIPGDYKWIQDLPELPESVRFLDLPSAVIEESTEGFPFSDRAIMRRSKVGSSMLKRPNQFHLFKALKSSAALANLRLAVWTDDPVPIVAAFCQAEATSALWVKRISERFVFTTDGVALKKLLKYGRDN